ERADGPRRRAADVDTQDGDQGGRRPRLGEARWRSAVAGHRHDSHAGLVADALRGLGERPRRARIDHQVDTLARQGQRAAVTEPLAGAAHERPFSGYAEIHRRTPRERESAMLPRARGSAHARATQRRRLPPSKVPSTPRMISRPSDEPIDRAALLAIASIAESFRPLPVSTPPSASFSAPPMPPPWSAGAPPA